MPEKLLANAVRELREAAHEAAWRQWGALGVMVTRQEPARAMIDPEALVLLSLALAEAERRLWDVLAWFARAGSIALSVQRAKNLVNKYPEPVRSRLGEFAHLALREGGDFRWRSLAHPLPARSVRTQKSLGKRLELMGPPALTLRLRVGLAVGVKADLLGFLLGVGGVWVSARAIATATVYAPRSIRRAADEMVAARFIQATGETPAQYRVDPRPWGELLGEVAPWRYWQPLFALIAHLLEWMEGAPARESPYILSSRARDLVEQHRPAFTRNQIVIPNPEDYPGEDYLKAFADTLRRLTLWMEERV